MTRRVNAQTTRSPRTWLPIWTCRRWGHMPDKAGRCKRCGTAPIISKAGLRAVFRRLSKAFDTRSSKPPVPWDVLPPTKPPPKSRRIGRGGR